MSQEVTADTSVVVPAIALWHEVHDVAREALHAVSRLPAHVILEAIAVLTRLPQGLAVTPVVAVDVVLRSFPERPFVLPASAHERLVATIADHGLRGGLVYDALVAATAQYAHARLLTFDRRAEPAYRAVGVETSFLG